MPGLVGLAGSLSGGRDANAAALERMIRAMLHAPRYSIRRYVDDYVAIAQVGLPGAPAEAPRRPAGQFEFFLDGYLEPDILPADAASAEGTGCRGDEDVVRYLLETQGARGVERLRGVFALAVYDRVDHSTTIVSDRFGAGSLYWVCKDRRLAFAAEIKALLRSPIPLRRSVNLDAVAELITLDHILTNKTLFEEIELVPHASVMTVGADGDVRLRKYWEFPGAVRKSSAAFDDMVDEAAVHAEAAVKSFVRKGRRLGVSLSGGLDSRLVAGFASEVVDPLPVFHTGHRGLPETRFARQICAAVGGAWHYDDQALIDYGRIIPCGVYLTDGQVQANQFWCLHLAQAHAAPQVDVVLTGYLQDYVLGNLFLAEAGACARSAGDQTAYLERKVAKPRDFGILRAVFGAAAADDLRMRLRQGLERAVRGFEAEQWADLVRYFYLTSRARRYTLGLFGGATQSYVRVGFPGMDYRLFDFMLTVPDEWRREARFYRAIFSRRLPRLVHIPWEKTGLALDRYRSENEWRLRWKTLGRYYIQRATRGWVSPSDGRYHKDARYRRDRRFREFYRGVLLNPRAAGREYIGGEAIANVLRLQKSGYDCIYLLQSLMTIELFHRYFIDGEPPPDVSSAGAAGPDGEVIGRGLGNG